MAEPIVAVTITMNRKEIQEIAASREIGDELVEMAREGLPVAVGIAPVMTGFYKSQFKVSRRIERISRMRRQVARVTNKDPKAWAVEWGNGAHHTLGKTIEAMRGMR